MKVSYQRDLNRSYLVLQAEREIDMDSYPVRILLGGGVRTLLSCRVQTVDGSRAFYYDTTYLHPLSSRLRKNRLGGDELRRLLQSFVKALESIQSYLLDVSWLVIDPEYMFCREDSDELRLCCFPGYGRDIGEQFRGLMEYLLPMIDHDDSRGVVMAYGIYRQCVGGDFSVERLKESIFRDFGEDEAPSGEEQKKIAEEENRQEVMREFFEKEEEPEEKKGRIPWGTILVSMLWTVSLLGICFARYMGYLTFLTFPMILGIFIVLLAILGLNAVVLRRWRRDEESDGQTRWSESSMAQASIQWPGKQVADPEEIREIYRRGEEKRVEDAEPEPAPAPESVTTFIPEPVSSPAALSPEDTQPLPRIPETEEGRLLSREPGRFPDIPLMGDLTIIGKLPEAVDVRIALPTISRVHAKIRKVDGEYYVTDLGSRNGTYLNGSPVSNMENRRIQPGDTVRFADVEYEFAL